MASRLSSLFQVTLAAALTLPMHAQTPATQSVRMVEPPAPLLPDHFGSWSATGQADAALIADAAVAKELGVVRTSQRPFSSTLGQAVVAAEQMIDSTGAYSAFTLLRTPEMRACAEANTLGNDCAVSAGKLLFWAGNTVVLITPSGSRAVGAASFRDLLSVLPKPAGAKGAQPLLPTREPQEGLQISSVRYAVGPATYAAGGGGIPASVIDFSKSPEILTAHYAGRRGSGTLTTILYPTPTIAGDRLRAMQAALAGGQMPAGFSAGTPAFARSGPIVAIASNGFPLKEAERLANDVHYEATVSWNKPELYMEERKIPQTASALVRILFFVGFMAAAALILGIFFGGGRALVRFARGKPLSSLEDMEIIRLELPRGSSGPTWRQR